MVAALLVRRRGREGCDLFFLGELSFPPPPGILRSLSLSLSPFQSRSEKKQKKLILTSTMRALAASKSGSSSALVLVANLRNSSQPAFKEIAVALHCSSVAAASLSSRSMPIIVVARERLMTPVRACFESWFWFACRVLECQRAGGE